MKKKITYTTISLILLALIVFILFTTSFTPEKKAIQFIEKNAASFSILVDCGQPIPSTLDGKRVDIWDGPHTMYEFILGSGIGGTQYFGVYYSPDDVPLPFQNTNISLTANGEDSWIWQAEGDNHGMTRKITNQWYYFEASF